MTSSSNSVDCLRYYWCIFLLCVPDYIDFKTPRSFFQCKHIPRYCIIQIYSIIYSRSNRKRKRWLYNIFRGTCKHVKVCDEYVTEWTSPWQLPVFRGLCDLGSHICVYITLSLFCWSENVYNRSKEDLSKIEDTCNKEVILL